MPSKIKKRGENSYLLTVVHEQNEYTKTIKAESKLEADTEWKLFAAEVIKENVLPGNAEKKTLKQFYDYWKEKFANKRYAKTTLICYEQVFIRIDEGLGHLRLDKIKPTQLVDFFAQLASPDAKQNDTPLAHRSIAKHRELLSLLFSAAVKWDFTRSNPLNKVDKPRAERKQKKLPTQEEVANFFKCLSAAPTKNQLMCMLAFVGGMRREEFSALKWGDFDFDKNAVKIQRAATYIAGEGIHIGPTKTTSSDRFISLPASVMNLLKRFKIEVKELAARKAKRKKIVKFEDPTGNDKWLFTQPDGSIGHPHAANNFLKKFVTANNLFPFTPHMLRHLHGSYLLRNGLDISSVSKNLGHSKKSFTLDTYIHTIESIENETAAILQNVLNDFNKKKSKTKKVK